MNIRMAAALRGPLAAALVAALSLCAVAICAPGDAAAQERKMIRIDGSSPIFVLKELMVVISEEQGKVFVKIALPRKEGAKAADGEKLAENDVVLRVNGRKIASVAELKEIYEKAEVGAEIKIGVKRGEERVIVSFAKADPKDMPEGMMMKTIEAVPDSAAAVEKKE